MRLGGRLKASLFRFSLCTPPSRTPVFLKHQSTSKTLVRNITVMAQEGDRPTFEFEQAGWLKSFGATVWHEFSPLAMKHKAVNLGQGFPNFEPPSMILNAAAQALRGETPDIATPGPALINQYARPNGHLRIVKALAKLYSPLVGVELDPLTQFQITAGASDGIFTAIQALVSVGDEVIVFEPYFDIYEGAIARAGAKLVPVPMTLSRSAKRADEFKVDMNALKRAMNEKTRVLIINTPHNPTGKIFSRQELEEIADLVKQSPRAMVIADEVYEFMAYDRVEMARMCTLDGMWERTVSVSSAAKTFSVTGWKIGWCYGPPKLIDAVARAHQFITYAIATPLQEAIAVALERAQDENYFKRLHDEYAARRTLLMEALTNAGFNPVMPSGTFFIVCNIADLRRKLKDGEGSQHSLTKQNLHLGDWNFCRWLTVEIGVTAIPCSAFFNGESKPTDTIRFAFCKREEEIREAAKRLVKVKELLGDK